MKISFWCALAAVAALVGGCNSYRADLSFAHTTQLGYRNTGLVSAGDFWLWDTRSNELTVLEEDLQLAKLGSTRFASYRSDRVRGVSLSGNFGTEEEKAALEASVGQRLRFEVENAVRDRYDRTYDALSDRYESGLDADEDMRGRWYVDEATARESGLYYVIVRSVVRADRAEVEIGGAEGENVATLSIQLPGDVQPVRVDLVNAASAECSGESAPCFFDVSVIEPFFNASGNLDFRPARGVDRDRLAEALRRS